MLTQEDFQRERLESIEKGLMDYRSEKKAARRVGRLIGQIQVLQVFLHKTPTSVDELDALSEDTLKEMCSRLYEAARQAGFPVSRLSIPTVSSEPS